jgi:bifunctional ADP-heptose synthase (sugar kinase/adenylyltransferase)
MLDHWWVGTSTRRSAEANIPIVAIQQDFVELGGAGNVLMNLIALDCDPVAGYGEGPIKHRLVVDGVQIARWDQHDYCEEGMFEGSAFDGVIISDYNKGGFGTGVLNALAHLPGPFFIDSKKAPWFFECLPGEKFYFPNELEYELHAKHYNKVDNVIHKRGPLGLEYLKKGNLKLLLPAICKTPVSVCGAGDTVIAAFAASYLRGSSPYRAAIVANAAGSVVVAKPYTATASIVEIEEALRNATKSTYATQLV